MTLILYALFCIEAGAFGAAALQLLIEQPKDIVFVLAGVLFLCLGMKRSPTARKAMVRLQTERLK